MPLALTRLDGFLGFSAIALKLVEQSAGEEEQVGFGLRLTEADGVAQDGATEMTIGCRIDLHLMDGCTLDQKTERP